MNRERCKELLPIFKAFAEGKTIQWNHKQAEITIWNDCVDPSIPFDIDYLEYRIKPEPREFWIQRDLAKEGVQDGLSFVPKNDWIHVREVIDES